MHQGIDLWKEREGGREGRGEGGREGREVGGREEGGREEGKRERGRKGGEGEMKIFTVHVITSLNTEVVHVHNKHFIDFQSDTNRFVADKSCTVADSIISLWP